MNTALARFMGIDYGARRVGLAISDPLGIIAGPIGFIQRREGKRPPLAKVMERAKELEARGFVIGLPLDGEGNESEWTAEVRAFGAALGKRTGMQVIFVDERFSTATALRAIREMDASARGRKGDVDSLSATVLLQNALDTHK
ncbi:MAG: Holliday junction resolvase RuvX [Gemmatimonadaceae bacterium]